MILYSTQQVTDAVDKIAQQIRSHCDEENIDKITLVCVLKGAAMFCSDLGKLLTSKYGVNTSFDYIRIKSYIDDSSSHEVTLVNDITSNIAGEHIIIVEDIVDTGYSVKWLLNHFQSLGAASVSIATLVDKVARREVDDLVLDYVGFTLEDDYFVLGYGMDYNERFRGFSCIFDGKELQR